MLVYLLERLRTLDITPLVVATSNEESDNALAAYCDQIGQACFRGSLQDVASRYVAVAEQFGLGAAVRISGDSPLLDPQIITRCIELYESTNADLVTNVFPRSYPAGQSVEVIRIDTLKKCVAKMSVDDAEHVTKYLYRNAADFRIENLAAKEDLSGKHLAVDELEHFEACQQIIAQMTRPHWEYSLSEILAIHAGISASSAGH